MTIELSQAQRSYRQREQRDNDRRLATMRGRAWRNTMVAAINAGLAQGLFGLQPKQDWWPNAAANAWPHGAGHAHVFDFTIGDIPGRASVWDAGWDELRIHSVLWPTADGGGWLRVANVTDGRGMVGAVVATGWLERRNSRYLMPSPSLFYCAARRRAEVAALCLKPLGYADRGRFII